MTLAWRFIESSLFGRADQINKSPFGRIDLVGHGFVWVGLVGGGKENVGQTFSETFPKTQNDIYITQYKT